MKISYDDNYLFSVGADGSLFCHRVADKDGRSYRRDKEVTYAEEVLVTKSDMEELVLHSYIQYHIQYTYNGPHMQNDCFFVLLVYF